MKVLVLVISSSDKPCYEGHRAVWRERWNSHPSFHCKFLEMRGIAEGPPGEHGDTFFVEGEESMQPGVFRKTLAALAHYLDLGGYDFILRTNLSSLWIFDRFLPVVQSMPRCGVYAGVISSVRPYVSGGGILFSPDVARLVVNNEHLNTTNVVDDVDIGAILQALGVKPTWFPQHWHLSADDPIDPVHFHYYVKSTGDRTLEADTMRRIALACGSEVAPPERPAQADPDEGAVRELKACYSAAMHAVSDINEHLPVLRNYALKCLHVTECGVRGVCSSWAFAMGLLGREGARLVQIDLAMYPEAHTFAALAQRCGLETVFHAESDLTCPLEPTDLLFIDTWHVYGQMKRELDRWNSSVRKYILMHDTTVDADAGESLRCRMDIYGQSEATGIPLQEICRGIWPAVEEFLRDHPEWQLEARYSHNNGLTILKRVE